jgi:AraC-like DNA-binding protein
MPSPKERYLRLPADPRRDFPAFGPPQGDGMPLIINRAKLDTANFFRHCHDGAELFVVVGGEGLYLNQNQTVPLCVGDVFVVNDCQVHGFRNTRRLEMYNLLFEPQSLLPPLDLVGDLPGYYALFHWEPRHRREEGAFGHLRLSPELLRGLEPLLAAMEREYWDEPPGWRLAVKELFWQLVLRLSRHYQDVTTPVSRATVRMAEVLRLLETEAGQALSVTELAARTHLSVNQFRRVFRRATGAAPGAYRLQRALLRGASLLRDHGASVKEAAQATGFHDASHFTRLFRRHLGVKPSEYVPAP